MDWELSVSSVDSSSQLKRPDFGSRIFSLAGVASDCEDNDMLCGSPVRSLLGDSGIASL